MNVGRSNRLTRFDESALPEPGGVFSWAEREAWFTPDSHPDAPDRTVSCPEWWQFWWHSSEALPWVPVATCPSDATAGWGYYQPNPDLAAKAMRPSMTFNEIIDGVSVAS